MNLTLPILKGLQTAYDSIPVKDPNKIYITTDTGRIFLGETNIGAADIGRVVRSISFNEGTHVFTITYTDDTTQTIDLVLESVIQDISYDRETKTLTITLVNGATTDINLADLIDVYTGGETETTTTEVEAGEIFVDVKISEETDNAITIEEDGLYVKTPYGDETATATSIVDNGKVSVNVKVSSEVGNAVTIEEDGLYVETPFAVSGNIVVGTGTGIEDSGRNFVNIIEDSTELNSIPDVTAVKGALSIGTF